MSEKGRRKNNAIIIARRPFLECCFVVVASSLYYPFCYCCSMIVAFSSELLCRKLDNSATLNNSTKKEWYLKEVYY